MELGEGAYRERYYMPDEHRDPLNYPEAFCEPMGDEESSLIHHMSTEDQLNWREDPLFEETWALLADF